MPPLARGFPHLPLVRDALRLLVPAIRSGRLPSPTPRPWTGWKEYDASSPAIAAQRMARQIAEVFHLQVGVVVVTFVDKLENPGRVELGPGRDFFVDLDAQYRAQPRILGAILGHELAHIFLHQRGLGFADTLANEILTDTTAALFGFGALMADTFVVEQRAFPVEGGMQVVRTERAIGYLTPDELGYVLARSGLAAFADYLRSAAAKAAMEVGRRAAFLETSTPPLALAPFWRRWLYLLARAWAALRRGASGGLEHGRIYAFDEGKVCFRCPQCCQAMRLPLRRALTARCPSCELEMRCLT